MLRYPGYGQKGRVRAVSPSIFGSLCFFLYTHSKKVKISSSDLRVIDNRNKRCRRNKRERVLMTFEKAERERDI